MAYSTINVFSNWVTAGYHITILELHSLGTLSTELTRDNNFAALGTGFHDETENTVDGTADGETTEELVAERFGLGDSAETTVGDLFGVEFNGALGELEALLNNGGQLANAAALDTWRGLGEMDAM